jgi:hypothetical protein
MPEPVDGPEEALLEEQRRLSRKKQVRDVGYLGGIDVWQSLGSANVVAPAEQAATPVLSNSVLRVTEAAIRRRQLSRLERAAADRAVVTQPVEEKPRPRPPPQATLGSTLGSGMSVGNADRSDATMAREELARIMGGGSQPSRRLGPSDIARAMAVSESRAWNYFRPALSDEQNTRRKRGKRK